MQADSLYDICTAAKSVKFYYNLLRNKKPEMCLIVPAGYLQALLALFSQHDRIAGVSGQLVCISFCW